MPDTNAATQTEVHELIRARRSPYAFSDTPVSEEVLSAMLEAARWASSCFNEQPWRFIVGDRHRDSETFQKIVSTLMPQNAAWAVHAPVLIVSVAKLEFTHNGAPNRHALYDTGAASAQLTLQATALGLSVHQMGGFNPAAAREALSIPQGFEPVAIMAVGYPGNAADLNDVLRVRESGPRQRRPLQELVFHGNFGASSAS